MWDTLWTNANTIDANGQHLAQQAIAIEGDSIVWVGNNDEAVKQNAKHVIDCNGKLITPGLIDCHTHLVYAGNRAHEFEQRLQGKTYQQIAEQGGGIQSTVKQTRAASEQQLFDESLPRLNALRAQGVTTLEIKSGYGLDLATELKMLRVAKRLGRETGVRVKTTFLGAHAIPKDYDADDYIDFLCDEVLPQALAEGVVDAVDVFCESIAFNLAQTEKMFLKAIELNLPIKCHAEQLTDMGASAMAAAMGALSCEHLEYISPQSVKTMAEHQTVATLLPGAYYFLREEKKPPIELFREYNVPMAVATDANPGSCPCTSLLLIMNMACTLFDMRVDEVMAGITANAAKALGIFSLVGEIAVGKCADLVIWDVSSAAQLCYPIAANPGKQIIIAGEQVNV